MRLFLRGILTLICGLALLGRLYAGTFTVSNANDNGSGSLRQAINDVNAVDGPHQIIFDSLSNSIPVMSDLPGITHRVMIDGQGNKVYGSNTTIALFDFAPGSDGSTLTALAITGGLYGCSLSSNDNWVTGCYLGTPWDEAEGFGNYHGVIVNGSRNLIGGDRTLSQGNVIGGNLSDGVYLGFPNNVWDNRVCGNIIGVKSAQNGALRNGGSGVRVNLNASGTLVGLPISGWENIIAGNIGSGVWAYGSPTRVQNNYLGYCPLTGATYGNSSGVSLVGDFNIVGGDITTLERNVISGNSSGVVISGNSNTISGNFIGTNSLGTASAQNNHGIILNFGQGNLIGGLNNAGGLVHGNLISGNSGFGIYLMVSSPGNTIAGNIIGLNRDGTAALPNNNGIYIGNAGQGTVWIGHPSAYGRNVISGNTNDGIYKYDSSGPIVIRGNFIGVNAGGTASIANGYSGIEIMEGQSTWIGGPDITDRNWICGGPSEFGILVRGSTVESFSNTIQGNWIGILPNGAPQSPEGYQGILMNASGNLIGNRLGAAGNLISAWDTGIQISGGYVCDGLYANTLTACLSANLVLGSGANQNNPPPINLYADANTASGTANAGEYVEVFLAESGPASGSVRLLGYAFADITGHWQAPLSGAAAGEYVCAMASDGLNNTSGFSGKTLVLPPPPTATPTASGTATPTPTVSPTATITPTLTASGTITPTPTLSSTITISPTITPTPTVTSTMTASLTASPTLTMPSALLEGKILAYPNPAQKQVRFGMRMEREGSIEISIYNLIGEKVAEIKAIGSSEFTTVDWTCGQVAAGIYLAQVRIDGMVKANLKVAVIRP